MNKSNGIRFGQCAGKTMEWALLNEPCYLGWMIREDVPSKQFHGEAASHFRDLTTKAQALKLRVYCQSCHKDVADGMTVTTDANQRVVNVFFNCKGCAKTKDLPLLPPSLLAWPFQHTSDKSGSQKVRSALLCACAAPMLHEQPQEAMEAFFSNDDNFTTGTPVMTPIPGAQSEMRRKITDFGEATRAKLNGDQNTKNNTPGAAGRDADDNGGTDETYA